MSLSKPVLPQNDNVAHALAGAGGGILSMVLTYPLVTLSTRAQVEAAKLDNASFLATVRQIVARHGVSDLYSGLSSALFGISITNFVYYYWYEWTRAFFEAAAVKAGRASKKLTTVESMIAGAIAGSATVMLTNPIWVINTRITTKRHDADDAAADLEKGADGAAQPPRRPKRVTAIGTLLSMLRNEGPQSLWAGLMPALILVINPILQYTLFEQMKNAVERRGRRVTPTIAFCLGALGKLFATSITYPYITVKSQMHVAAKGDRKESVAQAISRVIKEEGYAGLYKGIGSKVTQSVLTAAFLFAFKDVLYERSVLLRASLSNKKLSS